MNSVSPKPVKVVETAGHIATSLGSFGLLLLGIAGVFTALSFADKSFGTETNLSTPVISPGFEIVPNGDSFLLLDRASGKVWSRSKYSEVWCEDYVQGITVVPGSNVTSTHKKAYECRN